MLFGIRMVELIVTLLFIFFLEVAILAGPQKIKNLWAGGNNAVIIRSNKEQGEYALMKD